MATYKELATNYVRRLRAGGMSNDRVIGQVANEINGLSIGGRPLTQVELDRLMREIGAELDRTGGTPAYIQDGSNYATVTLMSMLAARIGGKRARWST